MREWVNQAVAGIESDFQRSSDTHLIKVDLPALPDIWNEGRFDGVKARGGFEIDMKWKDQSITEVEILSKAGEICRIDAGGKFKVMKDGESIESKTYQDGSFEFKTIKGGVYKLAKW